MLLILHVPAEHASQGCHAPEDQRGHIVGEIERLRRGIGRVRYLES